MLVEARGDRRVARGGAGLAAEGEPGEGAGEEGEGAGLDEVELHLALAVEGLGGLFGRRCVG